MNSKNQKISEFMQLYKPVQHQLSAYCRVVTGSEEKALELIQETLAAAFENFHNLRKSGSFQFFLVGIARNCYLKQHRRRKFYGKQSEIKPVHISVTSDSIEMQFDMELIRKCINTLNSEQREVILLFYIMGFQIKEIAENLRITEAAVKNRMMRGRKRLRKLLSDKESQFTKHVSVNNFNTFTK